MKDKYSCAIIQDLMPTYIDELTSQETNEIMEQHIKECETCSNLLKIMKEPKIDNTELENEKFEIDFLKRSKKKSKQMITVAICIAVISIIAGCVIPFFTKHNLAYEELNLDLCVSDITIDDENVMDGLLSLTARAYGSYGISDIEFVEKNGVVTINATGERNRITTSTVYDAKYNAKHSINTIKYGDKTIWKDGVTISDDTLKIYKTAHPYVGDPSKNGETLAALKLFETLGESRLELHTVEEPYGMTIELLKQVEKTKQKYFEKYMGFVACNCLAVIDNLSYVTFRYKSEGGNNEITWDLERANEFLGKSVKEYGKSEMMLELLRMEYIAK